MRFPLLFLLSATLGVFAPLASRAGFTDGYYYYDGPYEVRVPNIAQIGAFQRCLEWCWAASAEVLTRSQGFCVPQEVFVARVYGPSLPCAPAYFPQITRALNAIYPTMEGGYVRLRAHGMEGVPRDARAILSSLDSGNPFILGLPMHAVVGYGAQYYHVYSLSGLYYYGPRISRLDFQDPFYIWDPIGHPAFNFIDLTVPQNWGYLNGIITISSEPVYAPSISQQPQSQVVGYGSNIVLSAVVAGSPPLAYRWFRDGLPLSNFRPVLTIRHATFRHSGEYQLAVRNQVSSVVSAEVMVTVVDVPPVFTTQPLSKTRREGTSVVFAARVRSRTKATYQWLFGGQAVTGATNAALRIRNLTSSNAGEYRVAASNYVGITLSAPATLTIAP